MYSKTETNIRMFYNLLAFFDIMPAAITTKETTSEQQTGANIQKLIFPFISFFFQSRSQRSLLPFSTEREGTG